MDNIRIIIGGIMLLMVAAYWVPASSAAQDSPSRQNVTDKDCTSPERVSGQGIPCNWSGWKKSIPEVKCDINRCSEYREILMLECSDGFITAVKAERVCAACWSR